MIRFFLTTAFGLALACPAMAQATRREGDEVAKLREQVRDLEAKLKKESGKKEDKEGEKKPDAKEAPKERPMGGLTGFGPGPFGGASPMGRGGEGPDFTRMPGFDRLSNDEQKTLTALVQKMRTPGEAPKGEAPKGAGNVEARLDRLEKAIEEIKGMLRGPMGGAPGTPGGRGPGAGGPGGGGAGGARPGPGGPDGGGGVGRPGGGDRR